MNKGKIVSILGQIVEVEFLENAPEAHDIIVLEDNPEVRMEVYGSSTPTSFYCMLLTDHANLSRGKIVLNTGEPIQIPVGNGILGRVMNVFGELEDEKGVLQNVQKRPIFGDAVSYDDVVVPHELLETGIKAIDFFSPLLRGGKMGLFGGAGVGKTILLTEIIHNVVVLNGKNAEGQRVGESKSQRGTGSEVQSDRESESQKLGVSSQMSEVSQKHSAVSVFTGIGERVREGQELYETLTESGAMDEVALIFGQMGENPAIRFRTAISGVAIAESFRDAGRDVLFFIDNIFRYAQAGYELSTLMNTLPGEGGYQATLSSEMAQFHERLISTAKSSITSIEAVYVPSDDMTDNGVQSIFPYLDSIAVLSRDVYQQGHFPAVDLLSSTSSALSIDIVGEDHYKAVIETQDLLKRAVALDRIVSLIGESELNPADQKIYQRSRLIKNYMTQNFFVAAPQTGVPGKFVVLKDTISDIRAILSGKWDSIDAQKLMYVGTLTELEKIVPRPVSVPTPPQPPTPPVPPSGK